MMMRRDPLRLALALSLLTVMAMPWPAHAQTPSSGGPVDPVLTQELVIANRVLTDLGVIDGFGHVSMRHPTNPERYLIGRSVAPALVTAGDILEYDLDSSPVDAKGRASFLERFIHGEIYKARPDVTAVVHTHSAGVIPFGVSKVPLRPVFHIAGFLAPSAAFAKRRADARSRQRGGGRDAADGGVPCLLQRRQCTSAVASAGPWRRGQLSRPGGESENPGRDRPDSRPSLGSVEAGRLGENAAEIMPGRARPAQGIQIGAGV
jgi:hypothetical protein